MELELASAARTVRCKHQLLLCNVCAIRTRDCTLAARVRNGERPRNERRIESDVVVREDIIAKRGTKNQRRLVERRRGMYVVEEKGLREGSAESEKDKRYAIDVVS